MTIAGKAAGVFIGIVSDRDDTDGLGRVKVTLPAYANRETDWVRVAVPYGGSAGADGHGFYWIPEKGDEVLIAFVHNDPKVPVVIGCLYSQKQKPPATKADEHVLRSRNGHTITVSDEAGHERIEIKAKSGQLVTIDETSGTVTLKGTQKVVIDAPSVELGGSPATMHAILGETFMTAFALHTHTVLPTAMTGPVTPPIPSSSVLSTITKLKA
jgi:phage baseplate assembly protein V